MAWVMGVLAQSTAAAAQSVVFINPGRSDERYWTTVSEVMQDAASSLGMQLQVRSAQRDHLRPIEIARQIAALPKAQRPRYVMFTNDYSVAPEILRTLEAAGIDSFMAFSGVPETLRGQTGVARERYRHWLGSREPGAEEAGYLPAKSRFAAARASGQARAADGRLHMVAIAGDRSTPSSVERNAGMRRAAAEASDVVLQQEVFGEWRRERAEQQAAVLFQRYPEVRLVWAGNDEMAFGAMQAFEEAGRTPGRDVLFGAVNSSPEALRARIDGRLSALMGGHFTLGGWAMVMLHDDAQGVALNRDGQRVHSAPVLQAIDEAKARRWLKLLERPDYGVDFLHYSAEGRPASYQYPFLTSPVDY